MKLSKNILISTMYIYNLFDAHSFMESNSRKNANDNYILRKKYTVKKNKINFNETNFSFFTITFCQFGTSIFFPKQYIETH